MARVFDTRKGDRHNPETRRAYMREYMRDRRGNGMRSDLPFVGIDGEGGGEQGDIHPGYHAYFLLACGETSILPNSGNIRITSGQALEYISQLPVGYTYVGYFFDYDVTKILEDLPDAKLTKLMDRKLRTRKDGRGVFPVEYGPYQIDYLPRKEFKVRKGQQPWVVINDVGPFFQCRFAEALRQWGVGTEDQLEVIDRGKSMRGNFLISDVEEIAAYNRMEIVLLQELMEKFRVACKQVGIVPAKWQGPGQLAKALMQKNGVPRSKDVPLLNDPAFIELMEYGRKAYYGGRPELTAVGPVTRPVWQWDINSAYPAAMMHVPCLMHGGWEKEEYVGGMDAAKIKGDCALVYGSFSPRLLPPGHSRPMLNGLPFRRADGSICYPGSGTGWYWSFEIEASVHQSFRADSAWVYNRQCDCDPLGWISEVYDQRISLGKDGPGIVLKLAVNSVYGISVQSIGRPEYANPIWGSFITAYCRTDIQGFIHSSPSCKAGGCGRDVLMIATDSVATWRDRTGEVEQSKALGGWSVESHPRGMFLVQPGLYFGSSGKHAKTRGVPLSVIEEKEAEFRAHFDTMVRSKRLEDGDVYVPQHMFVGIRYALHRRNRKLLGQWIEFGTDDPTKPSGKVIRFDWTTKRVPYPILEPNASHSWLQTFPIVGSVDDVTVPYSKDIGGIQQREIERLVLEAMPDWQPIIEPGEMS